MDLISIIVPVYNTETYLEQCIESLINQSYENIEIILVNDGSSDNSLKVCREYAKEESRIKVIDQVNKGVSAARNAGIDNACGQYITFVDSDDYVFNDYCKILMNFMNKNNVDLVYGGQYSLSNSKLIQINNRLSDGFYLANDILKDMIDDGNMSGFLLHSTCAVLYKTEIIKNDNVRFDPMLKYNEDGYFNLMYCLKSSAVYIIQKKHIYVYRVNDSSATHNKLDINVKYGVLLKRLEELNLKYPQHRFDLQLERRKVTLALEQLNSMLDISKKEWTKKAEAICKDTEIKNGLAKIDVNRIDINKKIFYVLLKEDKIRLLYYWLKFIRPLLKRMFKR